MRVPHSVHGRIWGDRGAASGHAAQPQAAMGWQERWLSVGGTASAAARTMVVRLPPSATSMTRPRCLGVRIASYTLIRFTEPGPRSVCVCSAAPPSALDSGHAGLAVGGFTRTWNSRMVGSCWICTQRRVGRPGRPGRCRSRGPSKAQAHIGDWAWEELDGHLLAVLLVLHDSHSAPQGQGRDSAGAAGQQGAPS